MTALDPAAWSALGLSVRLATVTTLLLLVLCTPLAWWLARSPSRWRALIEPLTALPLVLPPSVLGFYLLVFLGPTGIGGRLLAQLGVKPLVFTFPGLVLGSALYSLPFVVQPLRNSFAAIPNALLESAALLRASAADRFVSLALPLARPGLVSAAVLAFAHTLGEFGVVLMLGGNIPGRTQTASVLIFDRVETMDYAAARQASLILLVLCSILLLFLYARRRSPSPLP